MERKQAPNVTMLPYILEILSRQPDLAMSVYDIEKTLKKYLKSSRGIKKEIQFALMLGHNMGLFSLTGDRVCVRFSYRSPTGIQEPTPPQFNEKRGATIGRILKRKKGSDHHRLTAMSPDPKKYKATVEQKYGRVKKDSKKNKVGKKQQRVAL